MIVAVVFEKKFLEILLKQDGSITSEIFLKLNMNELSEYMHIVRHPRHLCPESKVTKNAFSNRNFIDEHFCLFNCTHKDQNKDRAATK